MLKKITLVCGIAIVLSALAVGASLPAQAAAGDTISADALPGLCTAGGGQVVVPSNSALMIEGGTALLSTLCEITPGNNASVFIENAVIDASPAGFPVGFFAICLDFPCGTNVTVHIDSSTIHEGSPPFSTGSMILSAPGSSGLMTVQNSTITAPGTTFVTSDGTTVVENTTFVESATVIHGGVKCHSENNTPAVSCS